MKISPLILLLAVTAAAEPPLPSWDSVERKRMIEEGWIAGGSLLTYGELPTEDEPEALLQVEEPTAEELAAAPEDEREISEEYLAAYFAEKPEGHLVDPQGLLSERERKDMEAFLEYHAGDSLIDVYVYVFGANQQIPGDVREEEVVERLYSVGKPAVVVYYYLGTPQRSTIYLSPVITDTVSAAEQRRALESSVMQAFGSTKAFDQLEAFLVQMSIRIYWMERMTKGTAGETRKEVPEGVRVFKKAKADAEKPLVIPAPLRMAAAVGAMVLGGLIVLASLVMWWRSRAKFRFPEFDVEPRLGGSHAAGIGAVISFASPAIPPAMQRKQVPDYLRRA